MQLTASLGRLCNYLPFKHVPGDILTGKHRIWPKLNVKYKRVLLRRIDTELNNMKLISRPFISPDESKLVYEQLQREKRIKEREEQLARVRANKNKMEDRRFVDHFAPLRPHQTWE